MASNSRITSRDQKASLIEDGGISSASGAILFTDADSADTHTYMSSLYSVNGTLTSSGAYGAFKLTPNTDSTGGRTGNLGWTYTVGAATQGLARGEVRTETYRVAITDSSGGSSSTDVVITLTGTNDAVMKVEGAQQTAMVVEDSAAAALKKTGVVEFTDVDLRDTHAVSFTGTAKYGTFTVVKNADSTNGAKGKVTWTYTGDNAKLQSLGNAGGTETFNISITDSQGSTLIVPVTVTLQGSDDAVVFTTAIQRGSVVEDTVLTTQGSVTFSDVELSDVHTASIAGAAGLSKDGTYGTFSLVGSVVETLGSGRGSQGWKYAVDHAKADFLGRGQTMTETFTVNVSDGFKTVGQAVTITITGTNDLVLLSSAASNLVGDVTENLAMKTSATGVVAFTDVDLIDTHGVSFTGAAKYGSFALGTLADSTRTGAGSVVWTYTLDARSESLAEGQSVTETFMVQVTDRQGSTLSTPVTITLHGSNDAVMITSGDRMEALVEDSGLLLTDAGDHNVVGYGTVTFRDVDLIDTHTTYVSVNGVPPNTDGDPVKFAVGTYGTLSLTAGEFVDSTNGVAGSQKWVYLVDNASADQLKQGEKVTEEFVIYVDDGHNSVGSQLVTIVLTGTNDAPTIESTATDLSGTVIEALSSFDPVVADAILADGEEVVPAMDELAALMVTGRVVGFDVDHDAVLTYGITDAFTAEFAPEGEESGDVPDDLAVMVSQLSEAFSIDSETGVWTFNATEADLEALGSGDELTLTFGVMVQDEFEESDSATVTITVRGTNDAPVIGESKVLRSALVEDGGEEALSAGSGMASGQVVASDVDYHDVVSYELVDAETQATFLASGSDEPAGPLPEELADLLDPALLSSFSIDRDTGAWTYDASALNLDALAQGDKLTLTFRVVVKDLDLAEAFTTVTVTITGTNDAPMIEELAVDPQALTVDAQASGYVADVATVSEDALTDAEFETIVATGRLRYSDVDFRDTAVFSAIDALPTLTYVAAEDGNDNALDDLFDSEALATALQEAFTLKADGSWSLDITGLNLDALADRDQLIVRLPVHLQDSDGGFDDSEVVVTILGTNDAPMFAMDSSFSGSLTENATTGVTATEGLDLNGNPVPVGSPSNAVSGQIFFSDVDSGDHAEIDAKTTLADVGVTYAVYRDGGGFDTSFKVPEGIAAGLVDLAAAFHIADNGVWTYDATFVAPYLEALGEKDELRLTYTITLTDESQATTEQELTITLKGTNDRPVVENAVTASVLENALPDSLVSIDLTVGVTDVDASDNLSVREFDLSTDGLNGVTVEGNLLQVNTDSTEFNALAAGEMRVITVDYTVSDDSGQPNDSVRQTATVKVTGVNDGPVGNDDVYAGQPLIEAGSSMSPDTAVAGQAMASGNVLKNDSDVDHGAKLSVVSVDGLAVLAPAAGSHAFGGKVGYYFIDSGMGEDFQVSDIAKVGDTPVKLDTLTAVELTGVDILDVLRSYASVSEYSAHRSEVFQAVFNGATLIVNDRTLDSSLVPDGSAFNVRLNYTDDVDLGTDNPFFVNGAGGMLTNASLDGGNFSAHGSVSRSMLPEGAQVLLTVGGSPDEIVAFEYGYGAGKVIYSTVPLDFYLQFGSDYGFSPELIEGMHTYAANLLSFAASEASAVDAGTQVEGLYGTLTLHSDGSYEYVLDNSKVATQALAQGDVANDVFTYTVSDELGATDTATLTLAVYGTNDQPVLASSLSLSLSEDGVLEAMAAEPSTSFTLDLLRGASDVDTGDVLSVRAESFNYLVDGQATEFIPSGLSFDAETFSLSVDSSAYQELAEGEIRTIVLTYEVMDDSDAGNSAVMQTATITITGTNDAPTIASADSMGSVRELTDSMEAVGAVLSDEGTIVFSDVDLRDTHTVRAMPSEANESSLGSFSVELDPITKTVTWTYNVADETVNHLAEGETLVQTYDVVIQEEKSSVVPIDRSVVASTLSQMGYAVDNEVVFGGTHYLLVRTSNYNAISSQELDASLHASDLGVYLASITSAEENAAVKTLLHGFTSQAYLGANDYAVEGNFVWSSGERFEYSNWAEGEPNNLNDEDSVEMYASGFWNDIPDGERFYAIVEVPGARAVTVGGELVTQQVQITITGTNDAPILAAQAPVEVLDTFAFDAGVTSSGSLKATDVDNGAVLTYGTVAASGAFVSGSAGKLALPSKGMSDTNEFGDIFLQGEHLALGFASTGHLGSVGSVPQGYVSDAEVFGLSLLGLDTSSGDTYIPGSPVEGFDLGYSAMGSVRNAYVSENGNSLGFRFVSNTNTSAGGELSAVFESRAGDVLLTQNIHFQPGSHFFKTDVTVTNLGRTGLDDVRYVRTGDPDQDLTRYDTFETINEVVSQASGDAGYGLVTATGPKSFAVVGYYTTDAEAKVSSYGFANTYAFDANLYELAPASLGAYFVDGAINITKSFGALSAGASESFSFYTFDTADLKGTLAEIMGSAGTQPLVLQGVYGTLTLAPDGAYQYVADDAKLNALGVDVNVTDTFTVAVSDEFGAVDQKPLTFSLVGANDTPTVVSELRLSVQEDSGISTVDLLMGASDVDTDDSVSVDGESIVYSVDGGVAVAMAPTGVLFDGGHTLSVDASSAAFQGLRDGQTLDLTVTYDITDEFGATVAQTATVTVTGENDAVSLTTPKFVPTLLTFEGVGNLSPVAGYYANLGIVFADGTAGLVDSDVGGSGDISHEPSPSTVAFPFGSNTIVANVADGFEGGLAFNYTNPFPLGPVNVTIYDGLDGRGTVLYTSALATTLPGSDPKDPGRYSLDGLFLGKFFGVAKSFVIAGSIDNRFAIDDVVFSASITSSGTYAEALNASAQDLRDLTVSLVAHDQDVGDFLTVTSTVKSVTLDGEVFVLPESVATALTSVHAFSATPATATSNGGNVAVSFAFTPAPANLDFLGDGEELVLTYTVSVDDSFGPSTQDITVTVMGTNDQPVVVLAIAAELSEDQVAETFDLITDVVTDKDAHDTLSVVDGSVRYSVDGVDIGSDLPDGLVLGADGRSITIDPSLDSFDHLAAGAFTTLTVDYDVMDDSGTDTDTVHATATFTVNGVNDAPMADNVTDTTMLAEAGVRTVAPDTNVPELGVFAASGDVITDHVFDVDDGATAMVSKVGVTEASLDVGGVGTKVMGTYGDLVLFADGTYTYTVDNFRAATQALKGATSSMPADVGHEAFTYEVSDGFTDGTDVAQLFLNIQGTNDRPDASDATIRLTRESLDLANKAVFANYLQDFVIDPDSAALTFGRAVGQSATSEFGTINIDENTGTVTYTLLAAKVQAALTAGGNDLIDDIRFAVRDDPQGAMDIAMLHIDVNAFAVS